MGIVSEAVDCIGCEGHPVAPNNPCALCGRLAVSPSPSEMEVVATAHFDEECEICINLVAGAIERLDPSPGEDWSLVTLSSAQSALAARAAQVLRLTEENEALRAAIATPEAVHANMMRGGIPTLSIRQALHLHGEDALEKWDRAEAAEARIKALEAEKQEITDLILTADRFKVGEENGHHLHVVSRGPSLWAVSDGSSVLNSTGEWEHEPMPSNRADEFISRTRFTFADAIRRARTTLQKEQADG